MSRRTGAAKRSASGFPIPEAREEMLRVPAPVSILAIDPGPSHCGMCELVVDGREWELADIWDMKPVSCLWHVVSWATHPGPRWLVVEGFQLFPSKLQEQGMSRMGTPEIIGACKWLYLSSDRSDLAYFEQGASIKAHGLRYMERSGIVQAGSNQHKRDAEAHAWWRVAKLLGD